MKGIFAIFCLRLTGKGPAWYNEGKDSAMSPRRRRGCLGGRKTMNTRERFLRTMAFRETDRLPMLEWATWWNKTIDRWKTEGLVIRSVPGLTDGEALQRQFGLDLHLQTWVGIRTAAIGEKTSCSRGNRSERTYGLQVEK